MNPLEALLGGPDTPVQCADCDNGLACDVHYQTARARFAYYAAHPYRLECSMPGAVWLPDENICVVDEDGLGLTVSEEATADA